MDVVTTVSKYKVRDWRSTNQNRYYWGVVVSLIAEHVGLASEETHDMIKYLFLKDIRSIQGVRETLEVVIPKSTTTLKTDEFEELMRQVRTWASAELGLWIPTPDEAEY